jgi:hypothetical protein
MNLLGPDKLVHIAHPVALSGLDTLCGHMAGNTIREANKPADCPECLEVVRFCKKIRVKGVWK